MAELKRPGGELANRPLHFFSVFSCYLGSYLSSKGKSRFFIYDFETLKNGSWAAKNPDKIGGSAGYIFFVPSFCQAGTKKMICGLDRQIRTLGIL